MNLSVQGEETSMNDINIETQAAWISRFAGISALIIFSVNIPILREIRKEKNYTLINILVGLDCLDSLAHIPVLGLLCRYNGNIHFKIYSPWHLFSEPPQTGNRGLLPCF